MNNKGGGKSGTWSICQGASQSYSNGAFNDTVATPNQEKFGTFIPATQEINIMTGTSCSASTCTGFNRGTSNHGWSGSKMFVIEYNMPNFTGNQANNDPAIWVLNAQVLRSAQYGCNCRGMGGSGGCGELDLVEVIPAGNLSQAITEIYSYKGATGSGANWWNRPYNTPVTLTATFDMASDSISVRQTSSFNWATSFTSTQMSASQSFDQTIAFGTASYPTSGNSVVPNLPNLVQQSPLYPTGPSSGPSASGPASSTGLRASEPQGPTVSLNSTGPSDTTVDLKPALGNSLQCSIVLLCAVLCAFI